MFRSGKLTVTVSSGSGAPLAALQLSEVTAAGGAAMTLGVPPPPQQAATAREISSLKHPSVPMSPLAASWILSFQVPASGLPLNTERAASGLNDPEKGAMPAETSVAAESSNTVEAPEQSLAPVP